MLVDTRRSYKYALRPTLDQENKLKMSLETHRRVYNNALAMRKEAYEKEGKTLRLKHQYPVFSQKRNLDVQYSREGIEGSHWLAQIAAVSMRDTIKRLDKAFDSFFRRVKEGGKPGYPRFRNRDRYNSIPFDNYNSGCVLVDKTKTPVFGDMPDAVSINCHRLKIFGVGSVKIKLHRPLRGKIKTVTVKREANRWYAIFSCDLGEQDVEKSTQPAIGIDVGIESFLTDSNGKQVENPKYLKENLQGIGRLARKIALRDNKKNKRRQYCKRGSRRRNENKRRLQKLHAKVKNKRRDFHHKTSLQLIRQHGLIAVESLNILGMLGNHRLARAIADASWSGFLQTLKYKAASAGVQVTEVDPRGTSQQCSGCSREVKKELSVRIHNCPHCGLILHRDHNAARNILDRALRLGRAGPAGVNAAPLVASATKGKRSPKIDSSPHTLRDPLAIWLEKARENHRHSQNGS